MTLPSLVNTPERLLSIRDMANLVAMVIVFFVTMIGFQDKKKMMAIFCFFLVLVFLHSLHVIYLGLTTGKRVFGVLDVYFIDFAGLGGLLSLILLIYSKGLMRVLAGVVFIVTTIGLILTQTRNAWLSFGFAVITLLIFLVFRAKRYQIKKLYAIIFLFVSIGVICITFLLTQDLNSNVSSRLDIQKQTTVIDINKPTDIGGNSFVSRAFIWHTAALAYLEHPVIGIGVYSFRYISRIYYKIPKSFYYLYVVGRTPHVTYLQVLTETGIIGLIFFVIFLVAIIRLMNKSAKLPKDKNDARLTLLINWSFVYIIFSMFMTESWLYGQYIVWMGVLLGFLVNNYKLMSNYDKT
jgi:O-antigen ligase